MITHDADGNLTFLMDGHAMDVEELFAHFLAMDDDEWKAACDALDTMIEAWDEANECRLSTAERREGH